MKKAWVAIVVMSLGVCLFSGKAYASAYLPAGTAVAPDARSTADQLLRKLFDAYRGFSRPGFEALVSDDFRPIRAKFISDADNRAHEGAVLDMQYSLNEVWTQKNRIIVAFNWEKKTYPAGAASPVLSRGRARAVFVYSAETWKLRSISGNNPF